MYLSLFLFYYLLFIFYQLFYYFTIIITFHLFLFFIFMFILFCLFISYLFIYLFRRLANLPATFISNSVKGELGYVRLIVQWDVWIMASLNHQGKVKDSPGS